VEGVVGVCEPELPHANELRITALMMALLKIERLIDECRI
jgi:hypothetical protein